MNLRDKFQNSRFLKVDGAFNFRCVGGYRSTIFPDAAIREGFLYRAGHLGDITSVGWHTVKSLGVSTVIDLTSPGEVEIFTGAPQTKLRPVGIEILRLPFRKGGFSLGSQVRKYQVYRNAGPEAIAEGYLNLMEAGLPTIRRVLELFRDNVGGFLIHCTMGKDRTGLIVGLLLSLAGVPRDTIAEDFSLTETHIEHLQPRLADIVESIDPNEEDPAAIAKMATECRREVMAFTLQYVDERYGGISQYAQEHCGFSVEEIDRIRQNMLSL